MKKTIINNPWKYIIIDEIFNNDDWVKIVESAEIVKKNYNKDGVQFVELIHSINNGVPESTAELIVNLADSILNDYKLIMSQFDVNISEYGYICKPQWGITKNILEEIHDDRYKDMSLNICITPDSNGTILYDRNEYNSSINSTNTGLLFCSNKNITNHAVDATDNTVVYLNIFFYKIDSWLDNNYLTQNLPLLDPIVVEWQAKLFSSGKLYRCSTQLPDLLL